MKAIVLNITTTDTSKSTPSTRTRRSKKNDTFGTYFRAELLPIIEMVGMALVLALAIAGAAFSWEYSQGKYMETEEVVNSIYMESIDFGNDQYTLVVNGEAFVFEGIPEPQR